MESIEKPTAPAFDASRIFKVILAMRIGQHVFISNRLLTFRGGPPPVEIFIPWGRDKIDLVFSRDAQLERVTDPSMWYSLSRVVHENKIETPSPELASLAELRSLSETPAATSPHAEED